MAAPHPSHDRDVGYTCLNCGQVTVPPNRSSIDSWTCNYCHSGFISFVMLSNLVPREFLDQIDRKGKKSEKQRPCLKCQRKMDRVPARHNGKQLELDVCRRCRLLWFDSGELMRALRYRNETIVSDEDEAPGAPARARDFRKAPSPAHAGASRAEAAGEPAWHTYGLIFVCLVLMPFAANYPRFIPRFGLSPVNPFRDYGLTWITSLFIHDTLMTLLGSMFVLLLVGSHLEERIGMGRYARIFLAAGLFGRLAYVLAATSRDPIYFGTSAALWGILAYAILTFPYRRVLFPSTHKYRSSAGLFAKCAVGAVTIFGVYVGWNFFSVAVMNAANGAQTIVYTDTLFTSMAAWVEGPYFRANLAGAGVGIVWCLVESITSLGTRVRARE